MKHLTRVAIACLGAFSALAQAGILQEPELPPAPPPAQTTVKAAPAVVALPPAPLSAPVENPTPPPPPATTTPPTTTAPTPPSKNDAAYRALLESALPLSPDQIMQLRRLYDLTQQAAAAAPSTPPTPVSSSLVVSLEPGSQPPIVRLSAGFVSSLVFVDSTGAPWPITAYGIGDPNAFNIQWDQISNALFVQSLKPYAHGNLAVRLADLNTPVMLSLVAGQKEIDYRVDLQVAGRGPKATAAILPTHASQSAEVNPILLNVLDGISPEGSRRLSVSPEVGQAWLGANNHVYFRTALTLLSPAWTASVASPNGTHVYEMLRTPLILASQQGKTLSIEIKGF